VFPAAFTPIARTVRSGTAIAAVTMAAAATKAAQAQHQRGAVERQRHRGVLGDRQQAVLFVGELIAAPRDAGRGKQKQQAEGTRYSSRRPHLVSVLRTMDGELEVSIRKGAD